MALRDHLSTTGEVSLHDLLSWIATGRLGLLSLVRARFPALGLTHPVGGKERPLGWMIRRTKKSLMPDSSEKGMEPKRRGLSSNGVMSRSMLLLVRRSDRLIVQVEFFQGEFRGAFDGRPGFGDGFDSDER